MVSINIEFINHKIIVDYCVILAYSKGLNHTLQAPFWTETASNEYNKTVILASKFHSY